MIDEACSFPCESPVFLRQNDPFSPYGGHNAQHRDPLLLNTRAIRLTTLQYWSLYLLYHGLRLAFWTLLHRKMLNVRVQGFCV